MAGDHQVKGCVVWLRRVLHVQVVPADSWIKLNLFNLRIFNHFTVLFVIDIIILASLVSKIRINFRAAIKGAVEMLIIIFLKIKAVVVFKCPGHFYLNLN